MARILALMSRRSHSLGSSDLCAQLPFSQPCVCSSHGTVGLKPHSEKRFSKILEFRIVMTVKAPRGGEERWQE